MVALSAHAGVVNCKQSQWASLDLGIIAVRDLVGVALGIVAGVFLVVIVARSRLVRDRVQRWRAAIVQWIDAV